jgi:hypothetical protein
MTPNELIATLPKYVQALYSDCVLYFSEEKNITTQERKNLVVNDIKLIKENITALEKHLNK